MSTANNLPLDAHAHEIFDMVLTTRKCKIASEVIKLGLFDKIEEMDNAVTADSLAAKMGYRKDFTERLLDGLVCYKFLDRRQDINGGANIYNMTEMASRYLTTKTESLIHVVTFETDNNLEGLEKLPFILKPGTNNEYYEEITGNKIEGTPSNPKDMKQKLAYFISVMVSKQLWMGKQITNSQDFSKYRSMLDIGGGVGFIAQEFLKVYPQMKCSVFDLPTVVDATLHQYPEMGQRITYVKGDFFVDELPKSDIILLSHILHNWSPEKCDIILRKVYQSLNPGGCILVAETCLNEDKIGPFGPVSMDLLMMIVFNGKERSFNEWSHLLQKYGFINVSVKKMDKYVQDLTIAYKPL